MRVLILGGGGFLGKRLAKELLSKGGLTHGAIKHMIVVDVIFRPDMLQGSRLEHMEGDFSNEPTIKCISGFSRDGSAEEIVRTSSRKSTSPITKLKRNDE